MKFFKRTFIWLFCIGLGVLSLLVLLAPYARLDGLSSETINGYRIIGELWMESFWGPMSAVLQILIIITGAGLLAVGLIGLIREFVASPVPEIKKGGVVLALSYTLLNLLLMIMLLILWATTRDSLTFSYRFTYGVLIAFIAGVIISVLLLVLIKVLGDTSVWVKRPREKKVKVTVQEQPAVAFVQPAQASYGQIPQPVSYALPPSASYGQPPAVSYGQQPVMSYAQQPMMSYGQMPQTSYGQMPMTSYGQMSPQALPYGAAPAPAPAPERGRQTIAYTPPCGPDPAAKKTSQARPAAQKALPPDPVVDFRFVDGMSEKQIRAAVEDLRAKAACGDADAQFRLGICYQNGTGVPKNLTTAAEWQQKASAQGHPQAKFVLGEYYIEGKGVSKKIVEGITLIKESAQKGFVGAQMRLGIYYQKGEYLPRDYEKAVSWYTKAAEQGNEHSINALKGFEKGLDGKWTMR